MENILLILNIILAIILNILTFILNHTIFKTLIKDEKKIFENVLLKYIGKHPKQFMNFMKKLYKQ